MRSLIPWETRLSRPFDDFRGEVDSLMERFFGSDDGPRWFGGFTPQTNVAETESEYEVTVDLPGLEPGDFSVEIKNGQLWISGERRQEKEEKKKTMHRTERFYGQFRRVIPLEADVSDENIHAEYREGVLRVHVPKTEAAKPKRIPVTT